MSQNINNYYEAFEVWADSKGWFLARLCAWGDKGWRCAEWISPNGNVVTLKIDASNQIKDLFNSVFNIPE